MAVKLKVAKINRLEHLKELLKTWEYDLAIYEEKTQDEDWKGVLIWVRINSPVYTAFRKLKRPLNLLTRDALSKKGYETYELETVDFYKYAFELLVQNLSDFTLVHHGDSKDLIKPV